MTAAVRIYKVGRSVDIWRWLCRRCLEVFKADGWAMRADVDPPRELPCDGDACRLARAS